MVTAPQAGRRVAPVRRARPGRGPALTALAAVALCLSAVTAPPARAAGGTPGVRETVCADSLSVRTAPGGAWMGTLTKPQTFDVERVSDGWAYGFAYGEVNRKGWVQDGWFC
ncbi:hypothetical protein ACFV3R_08440 [Streptomyces sp. NPDC059740]|uniref:hypothetical protein n=1 Tax=Streptomyces sp. NPDC059740 TaxID=3346926 RepID=UPI00365B0CC6